MLEIQSGDSGDTPGIWNFEFDPLNNNINRSIVTAITKQMMVGRKEVACYTKVFKDVLV